MLWAIWVECLVVADHKPKFMKKLFFLTIVVSMVGIFFLYSGYSAAIRYALNPDSSARINITIPEGSTGGQIADILEDKGLISSTEAFAFYLRQNDLGGELKAGRFIMQENFSMPKIVDILVEGKSSELGVTLLEGWTAKQIAEKLEAEELTTAESFMECMKTCEFDFNFVPDGYLEGYLYPDTYFVNAGNYSDEGFISRLINTLKNKLNNEDWLVINASDRDFEDIMIMASIVEREERNDDEKSTVAGILWNRYDANIGLGADATVLYALDRTSGGLSFEDLQVDSPYNTRKYAGLPPTPISNPSISSIRAALYSEDTDYWYYLHDSGGGIHYAKTLDEHNVNKARYIR